MSDTVTSTERMWNPDDSTLAYRAGVEVPAEEFARLIPESVWVNRRAIYDPRATNSFVIDPGSIVKPPAKAAPRKRAPTKKAAATKAAAKKTTARKH